MTRRGTRDENSHVLVVQTNTLRVRQLADLLDGLEALAVRLELVSETGRLRRKFPCYEPNSGSKLKAEILKVEIV